MPQRNPEEALKVLEEAQEKVIKDGGVIHEDSLWDANEMALDGANKESIADRIRRNRAMPCKPQGGWRTR